MAKALPAIMVGTLRNYELARGLTGPFISRFSCQLGTLENEEEAKADINFN